MNNPRLWIIVSGISGFTAVATGAFAAHGLQSVLNPEMMEIFRTGVLYQLIHSVVMLSVALSGNLKYLKSEIYFLSGIILFSFSLYSYSITALKILAMITPIGGVMLLTGWIILIINAVKNPLK